MLVAALLWSLGHRRAAGDLRGAGAVARLHHAAPPSCWSIDLERPERFYYILTRPNWRSWMVWGAYFLTAHGADLALWLAAGLARLHERALTALVAPAIVVAILATSYTGFLFAQGLARDLWQGPYAAFDLIAQAIAAGAAALLLASLLVATARRGGTAAGDGRLSARLSRTSSSCSFEHVLSPSPTRHHELAIAHDP